VVDYLESFADTDTELCTVIAEHLRDALSAVGVEDPQHPELAARRGLWLERSARRLIAVGSPREAVRAFEEALALAEPAQVTRLQLAAAKAALDAGTYDTCIEHALTAVGSKEVTAGDAAFGTAIAATALSVIWSFVYQPDPNTGLLNAILGIFHIGPISWLGDPAFVNGALIAVGIWGSAGFATVILSAALKGISSEILEAARTDGANEFQIFWRIILPMVSLPMSVLAVTLVVNVVKLFDIPFVMTAGGPGNASRVVALEFYQQYFSAGQFGKAAAVAVVMLIILIPVMIFNIRRFRSGSVV